MSERDHGKRRGDHAEFPPRDDSTVLTGQDARQRLISELWPTEEPSPDLSRRVMAAWRRERTGVQQPPADGAISRVPVASPWTVDGEVGRSEARPGLGVVTGDGEVMPARERAAAQTRQQARDGDGRHVGTPPFIAGWRVTAAIAAAAAAVIVLAWRPWDAAQVPAPIAEASQSQGHVVATIGQTVAIGDRAAAALEAGADLSWAVQERRVRVDQRRGSVLYRVRRGGPFAVETPVGAVEVTGTSFRVSLDSKTGAGATGEVNVVEGSVIVRAVGSELRLGAGDRARFHAGRPPQLLANDNQSARTAPTPPVPLARRRVAIRSVVDADPRPRRAALLLPLGRDVEVFGDAIGEVSLATPGVTPGTSVVVARDRGFRQVIWRGDASGPFVTVPAPTRGELFWRSGADAETAGQDIGHARFAPEPRRQATGSPRNLVAEGPESTTVYFQKALPALTLSWPPVAAASRYRVRVRRADASGTRVLDAHVREARWALVPGALGEGRYVWSATALDSHDRQLGTPRDNRLALSFDNAARGLSLDPPGRAGVGRAATISGVAPIGATLFVNGAPAALDDEGRFAFRVDGQARDLVFRLVRTDGSESYWVRSLR